jgi:hypothetical protein
LKRRQPADRGRPIIKTSLNIISALAAVLPVFASAQGQPVNIIFTSDNASCSAWLKSADNKLVRAQYEFWVRGFASGHNFANQAHQIKIGAFPGGDALYRYLDQYCREHPQNTFVDGTIQLIAALRNPVAPKQSPAESPPSKTAPPKAAIPPPTK